MWHQKVDDFESLIWKVIGTNSITWLFLGIYKSKNLLYTWKKIYQGVEILTKI